MKRFMLVVIGSVMLAGSAEAKHHGEGKGHDHGGGKGINVQQDAIPEGSRPYGLDKQGKTPKGLEKQGKTPPGWSKGKKKGWFKNRGQKTPHAQGD